MIKLETQNDELRNKLETKETVKPKRPVARVKPVKYNPFKKTNLVWPKKLETTLSAVRVTVYD